MNELVTVHLDGTTTRRKLTPEESALLRKRFFQKFDPQTLESRSLQKLRSEAAQASRPLPKDASPPI